MQKSFLLFKVLFGQNLSFLLLLNSNKIIRKIWVLYHILRSYCSMSAAIQRRSSMTNARPTRVACQCSHFFRLQKFRLMHSTNHVMHEPCSNEKSPTNWTLELKESKSLTFKSCPKAESFSSIILSLHLLSYWRQIAINYFSFMYEIQWNIRQWDYCETRISREFFYYDWHWALCYL